MSVCNIFLEKMIRMSGRSCFLKNATMTLLAFNKTIYHNTKPFVIRNLSPNISCPTWCDNTTKCCLAYAKHKYIGWDSKNMIYKLSLVDANKLGLRDAVLFMRRLNNHIMSVNELQHAYETIMLGASHIAPTVHAFWIDRNGKSNVLCMVMDAYLPLMATMNMLQITVSPRPLVQSIQQKLTAMALLGCLHLDLHGENVMIRLIDGHWDVRFIDFVDVHATDVISVDCMLLMMMS